MGDFSDLQRTDWFQKHEAELPYVLQPAESPYLNIIKPLWSVLMSRLRSIFPPPPPLKQLEDVPHEERYSISLETTQN